MIVKDARTPRGRYEESGPTSEFSQIQALAPGAVLPDGMTWMTLNRINGPDRRLPDSPPREYRPRNLLTYTAQCDECGEEFQAIRTTAKTCSDRCRQRRCQARKRAS